MSHSNTLSSLDGDLERGTCEATAAPLDLELLVNRQMIGCAAGPGHDNWTSIFNMSNRLLFVCSFSGRKASKSV